MDQEPITIEDVQDIKASLERIEAGIKSILAGKEKEKEKPKMSLEDHEPGVQKLVAAAAQNDEQPE